MRSLTLCNLVSMASVAWITVTASLMTENRDVDKYKPRNVTVDIINSTSIVVRWQPPEIEVTCPTRRYSIRLKKDDSNRAKTWRFDASQRMATLSGLAPSSLYYVRLVTDNCDGKSKPTRWVTARTPHGLLERTTKNIKERRVSGVGSHEAPGQPTNVRSRPYPDSVFLSWGPPEGGAVVAGYMIGYGEGVPDVNWQYLEGHRRNVTIRNLKTGTQYVVSVRAFNDFDKGPVVYDLVYTTDSTDAVSAMSPPPTNLISKILSPSTALLQWRDPSLGRIQHINDNRYYNVHYQAMPNGKTMSVIVKELQVVLYDLVPATKYDFKVRTVKDGQTSLFSDTVSNRTLDPALTWSTPGVQGHTPKGQGHTESDLNEDYESYDDDVGRPEGVETASLVKDPEYNDRKTRREPQSTRPAVQSTSPDHLQVSFKSIIHYRVSAYVTWAEQLDSCSDRLVDGYKLRYQTLDDAGEFVTVRLTENFVLLENLLPNTRYKYQIKYIKSDGSETGWSQTGILDTRYTQDMI